MHHSLHPVGPYKTTRRIEKKTRARGIVVACIIIALILWGVNHFQYQSALKNGYDPSDTQTQSVVIPKGVGVKSVARDLEEKGLIGHARFFVRYMSDNDLEHSLIAGRFDLSPSMSIPEIVATVTDGKKAKNTLTIPEGFSIKQIDARIAMLRLAPAGTFMRAAQNIQNEKNKQLEGFLFPDTYTIDPAYFSAEQLIDAMLKNFEKKLPKDIGVQLAQKHITLEQLIIVASMVEKEGKLPEDLPIIAGIIWKRVNQGWFLNIDATLLYEKNDRDVTRKDLQKNTPYNTYTRKGLPPGPIGNPGLKAILAALNPQKTPYFFYLTDPKTGKAIFAATNTEHNLNRAKYLP